jgi:hypothetical protein
MRSELPASWSGVTTEHFRHKYKVGSAQYVSDKVRYSASAGKSQAESELSTYPVGGKVMVSYDPHDPSDSVLDSNVTGTIGTTIVGIVFLGLDAAFIMSALAPL